MFFKIQFLNHLFGFIFDVNLLNILKTYRICKIKLIINSLKPLNDEKSLSKPRISVE